jgi:sigma-B regulation protein RsbU (phosphoserine phosphatase)
MKQSKQVLIVDDTKETCLLLSILIERWGYIPIVADNGAEALQLINEKNIQLVICDWVMPNMDGIELCEQLRSSNIGHYIYLILLTGKKNKDDVVVSLKAGADDFMTKPINRHELKARLSTAERIISMENELEFKNKTLQLQHEYMKQSYDHLLNKAQLNEREKLFASAEVIVL